MDPATCDHRDVIAWSALLRSRFLKDDARGLNET